MFIQLIPKWRKFLILQRFCTAVPSCMARRIDSFSYGKNALSNETHFHCSCHATWHPCKTSFPLMLIGPCCCLVLSGLHTAYSSLQTRVGKPKLVRVNSTKKAANTFANCWRQIETCLPTVFMPFTHMHQLVIANTSLPTLVCRVKAALH